MKIRRSSRLAHEGEPLIGAAFAALFFCERECSKGWLVPQATAPERYDCAIITRSSSEAATVARGLVVLHVSAVVTIVQLYEVLPADTS